MLHGAGQGSPDQVDIGPVTELRWRAALRLTAATGPMFPGAGQRCFDQVNIGPVTESYSPAQLCVTLDVSEYTVDRVFLRYARHNRPALTSL